MIETKAGEFPLADDILESALGNDQKMQFYYWVKSGRESLKKGPDNFRAIQAVLFVGPPGAGKSLIQNLFITPAFGGREARPATILSGKSSFNSHINEAEHLMMEDEGLDSLKVRKQFTANLKQMVTSESVTHHPKYQMPVMVVPFRVITMSLNDDEEGLKSAPIIHPSFADKVTIFKVKKCNFMIPNGTLEERKVFRKQLLEELPHLLHYIDNLEIPDEFKCQRYGVKHYHNKEIMNLLTTKDFLEEIMEAFYTYMETSCDMPFIEGRADTLRDILKNFVDERRLPLSSDSMGRLLGRLQAKYPDRVSRKYVDGGYQQWAIFS
jgi:hypothetical protein